MSATTAAPVAGRAPGKHPVDQMLPVPRLALDLRHPAQPAVQRLGRQRQPGVEVHAQLAARGDAHRRPGRPDGSRAVRTGVRRPVPEVAVGRRAAYEARPFADVYDLRKAFQDSVFDADPERQLALIRSYPQLGSVFRDLTPANALSVADQAMAGLDRLDSDEHQTLDSLTQAYQAKFGFPLVMAVRENTKETIMRTGNARLQNRPGRRARDRPGRDREDREPAAARPGRGARLRRGRIGTSEGHRAERGGPA